MYPAVAPGVRLCLCDQDCERGAVAALGSMPYCRTGFRASTNSPTKFINLSSSPTSTRTVLSLTGAAPTFLETVFSVSRTTSSSRSGGGPLQLDNLLMKQNQVLITFDQKFSDCLEIFHARLYVRKSMVGSCPMIFPGRKSETGERNSHSVMSFTGRAFLYDWIGA
jgi:hypothetical protein